MFHVHRLRTSDRIFFVTVNLRRRVEPFRTAECAVLIEALEGARRRLGFLLYGYVLMPDHWHALIWTRHPLTISAARTHAKRRHVCATRRAAGSHVRQPA